MSDELEIVEAEILDESPEPEYEPGSMGARFGALCLDVILVTALFTLLLTQFFFPQFYPGALDEMMQLIGNEGGANFLDGASDYLQGALAVANVLSFCFVFLYFAFTPILLKGGTMGMRTFNLRIQQKDTNLPAPVSALIIRSLIKSAFLLVFFPLLTLLYLYALKTKQRLALHDLAARTRIVRAPAFTAQ